MPRDSESPEDVSFGLDAFPWAGGVLAGIGAYLLAYAVFLATIVFSTVVVSGTALTGGAVAIVRRTGYFFYNAQFVPTKVTQPVVVKVNGTTQQVITRELTKNHLLEATNPNIPIPVYVAIPVVVLVAVAVAYCRYHFDTRSVGRRTLLKRSLASGGALTLGYLLAMLLGTYLIAWRVTKGQLVQAREPVRLLALLSGTLYPLVLGTVGVGLTHLYDQLREDGTGGGDRDPPQTERD